MSPAAVLTSHVPATRLLDVFSPMMPRPRTRKNKFADISPRSLIVFTKGENPTFSYYLEERLRFYRSHMPVTVRCIQENCLADLEPDGAFVIICRYLRAKQTNWIKRNAERFAGVGLLIDDDVSGLVLGADAGMAHRVRLARLHLWPLWRLTNHLDLIWASTPALAKRLESDGCAVRVMQPLPTEQHSTPAPLPLYPTADVVIGFHATGVHAAEHQFLEPIISEILSRHDGAVFEVSAENRTARRWKSILPNAKLRIRPVLPWNEFACQSRQHPIDIALVPLLDKPINHVRSDTKRIDVSRMSAAAVFSDMETYSRNRHSGELMVDNNQEAWIKAIESLIESSDIRASARRATADAVAEMRSADPTIPGVLVSGRAS